MKYEVVLKINSKPEWVAAVLADFDSFLQDHADCERKASAMAMSFVAKYPDRDEIMGDLIATAIEELEHFQQVHKYMQKRNILLTHEMKQDVYVKGLIDHCRTGREQRFLDRLLIASIVEARGAERFEMISRHLEDEELKGFYHRLGVSEGRHCHIFLKMANIYFDEADIEARLQDWLEIEAVELDKLPLRPALH